jgi:drug/metabolite transporter (DMT)-like permease
MPTKTPSALATYLMVAGSSLFFCSKGVFAKSAYALGADPIEVLALRMGIALPFFVATAWASSRGAPRLSRRDWCSLAGLGFFGYYLSSYVNFTGLRYITVGLERIVLYSYPSLVLLGAALIGRRRLRGRTVVGLAVSYAGIVCAFAGEAGGHGSAGETSLGVGLVFVSAVTYAIFISVSGGLVGRLGPWRFTAITVGFSCLYILAHYSLTRPLSDIANLPPAVYLYGVWLAVFGTLVPAFLLGFGLRRAGAQRFAIIGTVGPVATLLLAWAVLGERPNLAQFAGFALALGGGLWVALDRDSGAAAYATQKKSSPST